MPDDTWANENRDFFKATLKSLVAENRKMPVEQTHHPQTQSVRFDQAACDSPSKAMRVSLWLSGDQFALLSGLCTTGGTSNSECLLPRGSPGHVLPFCSQTAPLLERSRIGVRWDFPFLPLEKGGQYTHALALLAQLIFPLLLDRQDRVPPLLVIRCSFMLGAFS